MASKNNIQWLSKQLPNWVDSRLVSESQAQAILAQYEGDSTFNLGRTIFSAIGALMIGLGIILFFAYNWQEMHRFFKLAVIFSFLIAAYVGSIWFDLPPRKHRPASEGLAFLGTMLFGAAIWLISQIYHIDEHYPNAFFLWGAAAIAVGWVRKSFVQCLTGIILFSVWGGLEIFEYGRVFHSSPWLILLSSTTLAWSLKSRTLLFLSISSFLFLWFFSLVKPLDETVAYFVLAVSIVIAQFGMGLERVTIKWRDFRTVIATPGFIVYMLVIYSLTFSELWEHKRLLIAYENLVQAGYFWGSLIVAILIPVIALVPSKLWSKAISTDIVHTGLMLLVLVLAFTVGPGLFDLNRGFIAALMNLVFLAHCSMFIVHGSKMQRGWEVSIGCLGFALLVFTRYTDLFESLLSRSLVFVILGVCIFFVGNFYSQQKKLPTKTRDELAGVAQ